MSAPGDEGKGRSGTEGDAGGGASAAGPRDIDRWMYEFAARLAHDMRTPLGAILMWGHVLRTGHEEDRLPAVDAIEASARAQSKMIVELVDISRAVMGRLPIARTDVDVRALVWSTVESLSPVARERTVELDVEPAAAAGDAGPGGGPTVIGDAARLGQAVANLVVRALKVTPAGRRVDVALATAADAVDIIVRDQGPRLDAAERADMFTPYRATVDPDGAPPPGGATGGMGLGLGLGLGLAFARCLIELHGGTIRAADRADEPGTTITVRLPRGPAPPPS